MKAQLSLEQPRTNQWEAPRNEYSSQDRQEDRRRPHHKEEPNQSYSREDNQEYQFQPTKYELKREAKRNTQQEEEYPKQRGNQRNVHVQEQIEHNERRNPEPVNTHSSQSRAGWNKESDNFNRAQPQEPTRLTLFEVKC